MAAPAQRIIDLLVADFMCDERFPVMTATAWTVKLRALERRIGDILDEVRYEARADAVREHVK